MKYITNNEIACHKFANAESLAEILLDEGYVVMLSKEEDLTIVNYIWSHRNADRNDVAFMSRDEIEDIIFNESEEN